MSCCSPSRSRGHGLAVAGLLATLALLLGAPASSHAAKAKGQERTLCADRVTVRDSPRGYAIGHLAKPQRLSVQSRVAVRGGAHWVLVRVVDEDLSGWIPEGALCRRR